MQPITINTEAGDLTLVPATVDQLRGIAHYWPMELAMNDDMPGIYGLVFQHGDQEVHGVRMQLVEAPEEEARWRFGLYRMLIAAALPYYLEKQHLGVMVPCAYRKKKGPDLYEIGIAFFVGPDPDSKSSAGCGEGSNFGFDDRLGDGAEAMVLDMIGALGHAMKQYDVPPLKRIGLEVKPRLAIGDIVMYFGIQGPDVIAIKDKLINDDPTWDYTVRAGFTHLPYAPMQPVGFRTTTPPDLPRV